MEDRDWTRRRILQAGAGLGLLALVPEAVLAAHATPPAPGTAGRFLSARELDTLRALVDRLIPGPPEDPDPGGVEMLVPEAIDLLLGAFAVDPPMIHSRGPFSDRAGAAKNGFVEFVPLDALAELAWRIRLEGSRGMPEREFNGPVKGLQTVYREGLAHLDERAGGSFAALPAPARDVLLAAPGDGAVDAFLATVFGHSIEAMYGPPEYRLDHRLAGWAYTGWGDTQPRGYTDAEVSGPAPRSGARAAPAAEPDPAGRAEVLRLLPLLAGRALGHPR